MFILYFINKFYNIILFLDLVLEKKKKDT